MTKDRETIEQILLKNNVVAQHEIEKALSIQKERGGNIGQILLDLNMIKKEDMFRARAAQLDMEFVELDNIDIAEEIIDIVDFNIAETYNIIPIDFDGKTVTLVLADPDNISILDDLRFMLDSEVKGAVASEKSIKAAFNKYYGDKKSSSMESLVAAFEGEDDIEILDSNNYKHDLERLQKDAHSKPVVKLLNLILLQAIKDRAADIHLEPFENDFKVRYRVDGILYEMLPPPAHLAIAITSRAKVMAKLNIAETRVPQDGRIELNVGGRPVDLRVSTLPTAFGESVVMRILDKSNVDLDIDQIGLRPDEAQIIKNLVALPNGIVLVTGPTGSGKTTTLYSALNYANKEDVKIITTEDPIEYDLPGIVQVEIKDDIGLTFASCLRSILRQDPDKILIGEIRDLETAKIAIQAALTGHVVFSTLHTNDAASSITRMIDLGVEPFLLSATLEAIIAQRLVRTICSNCRTEYTPQEEELYELELSPNDIGNKKFYYGKGCDICNGIGYKGRMALFEVITMSEEIRNLINKNASTDAVREVARTRGMRTLRGSGLLAIFDGLTTIEEVVRETVLTS